MDLDTSPERTAPIAALEHLTGPSRGTVSWLSSPGVCVSFGPDLLVHITNDSPVPDEWVAAARLRWTGETYAIESVDGQSLWINGRSLSSAELKHGDMIEFGETGPISCLRLLDRPKPLHWSIDDMIADSIGYLRASRRPLGRRVTWAAGDFGRRLVLETTVFFRATVVVALVALGWFTYSQSQRTVELETSIGARVEGIASSLARTRDEALRPGDLTALREEFGQSVTSAVERLEALEGLSGASARVIARSRASVAFIQGAYGLRSAETGAFMRHVAGPDGTPVISPTGQPLLALEGDGPIAEVQFTGTAFLVGSEGMLITNRHVAQPWRGSTNPVQLAAQGLEPVIIRLIGYFPGREEPVETELARVSETADLAVLRVVDPPAGLVGLTLAEIPPNPGDEVIVMGFPTGLRAMLAQSGAAFIKELQDAEDTDFWSVAERLARAGHILPLSSRGIVAQAGTEAILYDAETTHGGSGGPVLDSHGRVVAVNAAILPEFGGANLGVPAARLRALLEDDGQAPSR